MAAGENGRTERIVSRLIVKGIPGVSGQRQQYCRLKERGGGGGRAISVHVRRRIIEIHRPGTFPG